MSKKTKPGKILMLPVDQIEPSPYQARTQFDDNEIAALAVSILQNGLLQPVSVRQTGLRRYQLVAGERRLRACRLAKMQKVPAILTDVEDSESAALGLLENIQRAQLDPFDAARGIKAVIRLRNCTQAEAARRLGLSQPALANKLRLLTLTGEQQTLCTLGHLTERHARAALRLPENRRTEVLKRMGEEGMSVREADRMVDEMLERMRQPAPPPQQAQSQRKALPMVKDVRFFVNTLQHAVDVMTEQGIQATTTCGRKDGYLEYTVRIPVEGEGRGAKVAPPLPVSDAAPAAKPAPVPVACSTAPVGTLPDPGAEPLPGRDPAPEVFGLADAMLRQGFVEQDFSLQVEPVSGAEVTTRELRGTLRPVAPPVPEQPALAAAEN